MVPGRWVGGQHDEQKSLEELEEEQEGKDEEQGEEEKVGEANDEEQVES